MHEKISKSGKKIRIKKIKGISVSEYLQDIIPAELLLKILLNSVPVSVISCSPENLIELTVGYLINNGYVKQYSDINLLRICREDSDMTVKRNNFSMQVEVKTADSKLTSSYLKLISASCGNIDDFVLQQNIEEIKSRVKFESKTILKLNIETSSRQKHKKEFGGLHSAALFDNNGQFQLLMEDIGRHNCIDKVAGYMQIKKIETDDKIIFTTGRISLDLVYKIMKMGIPVIVTNSSITHSAALLAKKIKLTAIGYARGGRFNIYSGSWRIKE